MFKFITIFLFIISFNPSFSNETIGHRFIKTDLFHIGFGPYIKTNNRVENETKYFSDDPIVLVIPYIQIKYGSLFLTGESLKWNFFNNLYGQLDIRVDYKGHSYKSRGLNERSKTFYAGVAGRILFLKFDYVKSITDKNEASLYCLAATFPLYYNSTSSLMVQLETEWYDQEYTDYYFGISQEEALSSSFQSYKGYTSHNYHIQLSGSNDLTKYFSMHGSLSWRYYDDMIYKSPTVKDRNEFIFSSYIVLKI